MEGVVFTCSCFFMFFILPFTMQRSPGSAQASGMWFLPFWPCAPGAREASPIWPKHIASMSTTLQKAPHSITRLKLKVNPKKHTNHHRSTTLHHLAKQPYNIWLAYRNTASSDALPGVCYSVQSFGPLSCSSAALASLPLPPALPSSRATARLISSSLADGCADADPAAPVLPLPLFLSAFLFLAFCAQPTRLCCTCSSKISFLKKVPIFANKNNSSDHVSNSHNPQTIVNHSWKV